MSDEEHTNKETSINGQSTAAERASGGSSTVDTGNKAQADWLTAIAQLSEEKPDEDGEPGNPQEQESLGTLFEESGTDPVKADDRNARINKFLARTRKRVGPGSSETRAQNSGDEILHSPPTKDPTSGTARKSAVDTDPAIGASIQPPTKTAVKSPAPIPAKPTAAKPPRPVFDPKTGKPVHPGGSPAGATSEGAAATVAIEKPAEPGKKGLRGIFGEKKETKPDSPGSGASGQAVQDVPRNATGATTIVSPLSSQQGKTPARKPVFDPKTGKPVTDAAGGSQSAAGLINPAKVKSAQPAAPKQKFDPKTGKPVYTPVSTGTVATLKGAAAGIATAPSNGNGTKSGGFLSIFKKKLPHVTQRAEAPRFDVGPLNEPSHEGAFKDVNLTYPVGEPFQYVHIGFDHEAGELQYKVVEPALGSEELETLGVVERAFEKMISTNLDLIEGGHREEYLKDRFDSIISIFNLHVTKEQKDRIFFHLRKQYLGYGRIDTLMKDKYIEDISCNGSNLFLYVLHRIYGSVKTDVIYEEVELNNFVLKLAQISGRHVSLLQPIRDVTLPDGSRANLTLGSEVTKKGSTFTIRKFRANPISPIELMDYQSVDAQQLAYLWILMEYKRSILVSGGTATGKTTFLNVLCAFIPDEYKIVSIEDTAELNLMHPNWIESVTRMGFGAAEAVGASGVSGISRKAPGDISLYDLLVAALRQRPEFIIVGEVRGEEAFTLFQAIAVGHAALGTIHAGSMNELLARIESNPMNVPRSLLSNLDAVIFPMHIKKGERSLRRISNIVEILELDRESGDLITNTSYKWVPETDVFKFQGRTFLFDKIKETYGIGKDLLFQELKDRADFLNWLQRHNVRDYQQVGEMIRLYYRDKAEIMRRMGGKDHPLGSEYVHDPRLTEISG